MKKIIPFKKEIQFSSTISEITSISLEHEYNVEDDLISGKFIINGDYKINNTSINKEEYNYIIPFEIAIDSRYNPDTITLDIDNFYYEVLNEDTLKVNIDVLVEGEYKEEIIPVREEPILEEKLELPEIEDKKEDIIIEESNNELDLFKSINMEETYSIYHIYILKEEDNLDTIINKYQTNKETLEKYNDLTNLIPGTKLVIPCQNE